MPKAFSYVLWAVVLFKLLCPISFESAVSIIPVRGQSISQNMIYQKNPKVETGLQTVDQAINNGLISFTQPNEEHSVNPLQILTILAAYLWVIGLVVMVGYALVSYGLLHFRLRTTTRIHDAIYESDRIEGPFVVGLVRPRIYLPVGLTEGLDYVLNHEQAHIKRLDYIVKPIAFTALCLHWFNPLAWLAMGLIIKDMEMSADEYVLKKLGEQVRKNYSETLLKLSTKSGFAVPLAFGETGTKDRIKNVLNYRKPAFWAMVGAGLVIVAATVALATNPVSTTTLAKLEDFTHIMEMEATNAEIYTGGKSYSFTNQSTVGKLKKQVGDIKISKERILSDQEKSNGENVIRFEQSNLEGNASIGSIMFNGDFTEVWGMTSPHGFRVL